jgi:hypothetical protein
MEEIEQNHTSPSWEVTPVIIRYEAVWVLELIWMLWTTQKSLTLLEI